VSEVLARSRSVVSGARAAIEAARDHINDQNVYPVPDGDTGTNLALTVAAVDDALAAAHDPAPTAVAALVRRSALMGGRGNSGIILSQIVRGLCDALATAPDASEASLAMALRAASDAAYRAVRQPVEGTILTVIREMATAAEAAAGTGELRAAVLAAGEDAVARTPELLAVLRDAGVVDAGGAGLLEIVRGAFAGLSGEELIHAAAPLRAVATDHHAEPSPYRYCTSYVVSGTGVAMADLEAALTAIGDSLIVVGDSDATKVHVHTDDPGRALSLATAMGAVAAVEVADMHGQIVDRSHRLAQVVPVAPERRATDVVIVLQGEGNRAIAESLGARRVITGGQTMNPSTGDIVQALRLEGADGAVVLPCNANVLGAAQAAVAAFGTGSHVVEALSIPAGLAALVVYDPDASADRNAASMGAAAATVTSAEITRAVRSARVDGIDVREGDWIGLVEGTVTDAAPTFRAVVDAVTGRLLAADPVLVTALIGAEDADDARDAIAGVQTAHPAVEFDVRDGGQPHHSLLLGAE
jgi:DAK2 domain fusion protein YloV